MNFETLIEERQSLRKFKNKELSEAQLTELSDFFAGIDELVPGLNPKLEICTGDAKIRLEGIAGYQGYCFGAPAYLVLLSDEGEHALENAGYIGEQLCLKLTEMNLGSCWLTVMEPSAVRRALLLNTDQTVVAVIACGQAVSEKDVTRLDIKTMADVKVESRPGHIAPKISLEELVYDGSWGKTLVWDSEQVDPMLEKALYAASLAPSFLNRQGYRYLMNGSDLILFELDDPMATPEDKKLNLGATMFNFRVVYSNYNHTSGNWKFELPEIPASANVPENCTPIAVYKMW